MSVCISVYKPKLDLTYYGGGTFSDSFPIWFDELEKRAWSDNNIHLLINISYKNKIFKGNKSWKKYKNKLYSIGYNTFKISANNNIKYIPVDMVHYFQGWDFKKSFFKKKCTCIYCTTAKEIENFFRKYTKRSMNNILETILKNWEDGMIFECSW